ncbi:serine hydrolase [bacterium]|nr:serine hydrolase [bacterium]
MSETKGFAAPGFEAVREAFEANFAADLELGAGFAAFIGDEPVVDLWGGWRDRGRTLPWESDTLVPVYSTTKPIAGLVIARLVGQGIIDYERPLSAYWPEFAAAGKGEYTVAEALSHQAGVPGFPDPIDKDLWLDPPALAVALAHLAPMWPRGEGSGYHPLTHGYIAGELVRRASDRTLGTILREEICGPLGIDFHIGTPAREHARCAELQKPTQAPRFGAMNAAIRAAFLEPWSAPTRGGAAWREAEIPSANGHGTARSTAKLFSAIAQKGRLDGVTVVSRDAWDAFVRLRVSGPERVLPETVTFAAGVMVNTNTIYGPNPETLWHSGWGGSGAFADPDLGLAAAYVMNRQGSDLLRDARRDRLIDALYASL